MYQFLKKIVTIDEYLKHHFHDDEIKVIFTNGCFDVIHSGHLLLLAEAKQLGDYLIVGLNSDDSVRRLKGENRPIFNQDERSMLLASMEFVDHVIIFEENTPFALIKKIRPSVLVKGSDYKKEEIAGWDVVEHNGGEVILLPIHQGYSTTNIIRKIATLDLL